MFFAQAQIGERGKNKKIPLCLLLENGEIKIKNFFNSPLFLKLGTGRFCATKKSKDINSTFPPLGK